MKNHAKIAALEPKAAILASNVPTIEVENGRDISEPSVSCLEFYFYFLFCFLKMYNEKQTINN